MSSVGGFLECYECGNIIGGDAVWIDPNCNRLTLGYYGEPFHAECVPEELQGYDAIDPDYVKNSQSFVVTDPRRYKEVYDSIMEDMP